MDQKPKKFYWHANVSSGGTLSLSLNLEEGFPEDAKIGALAETLKRCHDFMEQKGYIPFDAQLMSSRDIAEKFGKTRQYWEKLLNEGKILYKETSAGRITTDLWVNGYLGDKEKVHRYVKNVRDVISTIKDSKKRASVIVCSVCGEERFDFAINRGSNINGICRACGFHVHTTD